MSRETLTNDEQIKQPLPEYKSHKTVWALKIGAILKGVQGFDGGVLIPFDLAFAPFQVSKEYIAKHDPQVGGYWVLYDDGYQSWSPAKAFEDGYSRV